MKTVVEFQQGTRRPSLPDHVEGIPVEVREAPNVSLTTCDHRQNSDSVEGGYAFGADNGGVSNGTAGWRVYYNSTRYVLTAAHLFGCSISSGEDALQWTQDFGETTNHFDSALDYALVEKTNSDVVLGNQAVHDGDSYQMVGHAENYEVLMEDNETTYKTGITTGSTTGSISSIDDSRGAGCISIGSDDALTYTNGQAEGDSGAAAFILDENYWGTERAIITGLCTLGVGPQIGTITCNGVDNEHFPRAGGASAEAIQSDMGSGFYFG